MAGKRREPGELESEILAVMWAAAAPLTPGEIAERLDGSLAHTTVQTILSRLLAKGAVIRESAGRAHAYTPVLNEAGLAARRMRAMLDRGEDREAVLNEFVDVLTPEDEDTLTRLLRSVRRNDGATE
ncbi:MAG: transcriptional repressor, CopY family [Pseudonocardiales bacterium]|nr:transcriptional repressor, CopY family [Jatrophihabitantaceae bacterium]MCW2602159.1 transcriptional repressor, CopY family [Pseudonocardiales bacterium]